jgi:hypothetical protein
MRSIQALISAAAFLVWSQAASACQELTYESSFEQSDIVFVGTLKRLVVRAKTPDGLRPLDAIFEVTQPIKGEIPQSITVRDTGNNCYRMPQFSLDWPASREYLVLAAKDNDGTYKTYHPLANTAMTDEKPLAVYKERALAFIKSLGR